MVLGQPLAELEAFHDRRRALGQDLFDEIWEGAYHAAPASHPWHGYLDNVLAELLGPLARAAGLVGTGPFNLGQSTTTGFLTGATTAACRRASGCPRPQSW